MDKQKWQHLFFSVGLPLIGLVLGQFFPAIQNALCLQPLNPNRWEEKALSLSTSIDAYHDRIEDFVVNKDWGDYPVSDKRRWA
jgi:hypothetical protein